MTTFALALLVLAALFVGYTYFGYYALVRWIGNRREPPPGSELQTEADLPRLAVLMCAFNESEQIGKKLRNCLELNYPRDRFRIVVVSDGSTDDTCEKVLEFADAGVLLIEAPKRQGKAACINLAMQSIDEEVVLMADVRQMLAPDSAKNLAHHFIDPEVGAVTGRLELTATEQEDGRQTFGKGVSGYWEHETRLRQAESVAHSVIGVTGAIYALRRSVFDPIPPGTILDDVLIPMNVVLNGHRVKFEEQAIAFDHVSKDVDHERKRKVRTLAGNFQLMSLRPELLSRDCNPILWMFVSHKLLRLLVPLAMLAALLVSLIAYTHHWIFAVSFWGQIAVYLMSIAPENIFKAIAVGPLRALRTFVQMHWFVVLGFIEFVSNKNLHLWDVSPSGDE